MKTYITENINTKYEKVRKEKRGKDNQNIR